MKLIARHQGEERAVEVRRQGDSYQVEIDARLYQVDIESFSATGRSLLIEGRQHEMAVRHAGEGRYQVASAAGLAEVEVVDPLTHLARQAHQGEDAGGGAKTTAYMPGRVVTLLVAEGESVESGQGVLVLEAMKMENEIRAERGGVVGRFFVSEGQAVETGDDLFEID